MNLRRPINHLDKLRRNNEKLSLRNVRDITPKLMIYERGGVGGDLERNYQWRKDRKSIQSNKAPKPSPSHHRQ